MNNKICTRTGTGRAEFLSEALMAVGGRFQRVFLPQYFG
jgi:hypothetical protein